MKFSFFLLAAAVCITTAASAQTTPPAPRNQTTLTPSSAAPALNPNSADNTRALPAAGAPDAIDNTTPTSGKDMTKDKKHKGSMSSGRRKMKTKM